MAPEIVNRKGHTFTADWWSFGVLMVRVEIYIPCVNDLCVIDETYRECKKKKSTNVT